jgi:pyrroloquinoline quinone (PQQ) biosynthesis protein C
VVGEESDLNAEGRRQSHFEIYLDAMNQIGADTSAIHMFMESLRQHSDFDLAYQYAQTPLAAQAFMNFTFNTISQNQNHVLAAIFTFGREDLIPGMFRNMVDEFHQKMPERISIFKYYLDRHIEIDGDHHSPLAMQMVANLCGEDENKWREAEAHVIDALRQRLNLWNAALTEIQLSKQITA